jgi:hypothetical protein
MYSKCAISLLVLTGGVLADQSSYSSAGNSYAAPAASSGYNAPSGGGNSYAAPSGGGNSYAAPSGGGNNYAAPAASAGYSAPTQTGYGVIQPSYTAPAAPYDVGAYDYIEPLEESAEGGADFSLESIIPLFLVVLAAVILAGLLGPLFSQLLMLVVALFPAALSIKAPIIQAILNPFNLGLCNIVAGNPPTLVMGRSLEDSDLNPEYVQYINLFMDSYSYIMGNMQ